MTISNIDLFIISSRISEINIIPSNFKRGDNFLKENL